MRAIFLYAISLYRRYISPLFPPACRFTPTCSEYAIEAFTRKSTGKAIWMTLARISRCHPFHPGGYDPVDPDGGQDPRTVACTEHPVPSPGCEADSRRGTSFSDT